ncbi:patatin-like phospholipase family protein [Nitrososphaera sp.]|uniref:patatin-like phospholipase family protein n=1 Tax=Nitrososphaera sp. TaxID=1971748 RepID=UPI00307DB3A1
MEKKEKQQQQQPSLPIRDIYRPKSETVLVMQGGGSLGAYECGVYKALDKHGIKFDIVAGTSIGAVNAGIVAGSKNPAQDLEDFWLSCVENLTPQALPDELRGMVASTVSALYGNPRMFAPMWRYWPLAANPLFVSPYLYSLDPLKKTLAQYVDFDRLSPGHSPRLIATATDLQKSESVVFDSGRRQVGAEHLVACAGFPFYGIGWAEIDGRYLWDGSLVSNTPLRDVIRASPENDKRVYIVSLFPKRQDKLPQNMADSWHRARDIMHNDKTDHDIHTSQVMTRYLDLMRRMHDLLNNAKIGEKLTAAFWELEREYHELTVERGTIIESVVKIERKEDVHYIFEDADFSATTIKKLIRQGEQDAHEALLDNNLAHPA